MMVIPKWLADLGLWVNRRYYRQLLRTVYGGTRTPPWFDHRIDLHYHWPHNLFWLERGILPLQYMVEGCTVLDLFCGDGFYSRYFYSTVAGHIDAIDKHPGAIAHARRWHSHSKIRYDVTDAVKEDFPSSWYDVIVWFEAIEHLSEAEYEKVVRRIKAAMGERGVLIGSTPIVLPHRLGKANWEHQNEFTDVEQLQDLLCRDFKDVEINVTVHAELGVGQRRTAHFTVKRAN